MSEKDPYTEFFNDSDQTKNYAAEPPKFVPGFFDLHRMVCLLIQERLPREGHILVHGAGGGLELESFSRFNQNWTFTGVDPAAPMLEDAKRRLGPLNDRTTLYHGFIHDAPDIKFDAATSLLTLHFLDAEDRRQTVSEIVRRLKPGAPFICVHCSFPLEETDLWLSRHYNYTVASGVSADVAETGCENIKNMLPVLNPEDDEAILRTCGLKNVTQFYTAFTWCGWVGYA